MDWLTISPTQIIGITLTAITLYAALLTIVKINGLRSFSKMASHDLAITVAIGSILGMIVLKEEPSILQGVWAIIVLLLMQTCLSLWRLKNKGYMFFENQPLLIMDGSEILEDNLRAARISHNDLWAKLREANISDMEDIKAVVFENSGELTVMHGPKDHPLDEEILRGVRKTP